ncbi:MAG: glycosyl hydrolase [Ginsengibacter sp.]
MKRITLVLSIIIFTGYSASCQSPLSWPAVKLENKPFTRWWWFGNAVDTTGINYNLKALQKAGFGGVEITPVYGVKGYESHFIDYLSPKWMKMLQFTIDDGSHLNMEVDMTTGTGWPFGGPQIPIKEAASKAIFQKYYLKSDEVLNEPIIVKSPAQKNIAPLQILMAYSDNGQKINLTDQVNKDGKLTWKAPDGNWELIAVFNGKTLQKVKRSSPGGEGWVMDHFSDTALHTYLNRFTKAFAENKTSSPHTFFNDSYEVYGANWSTNVFEEFAKRRGYKLEEFLPLLAGNGNADSVRRVIADYRETIGEMLLENFTIPWTNWAHKMGALTRNQAHGSPGNLIDLYAAVDIPECESFGTTKFDIPGINFDPKWMHASDSRALFQKFASSAAHITGKKYASSETFTWLREHFHTALSQCKPELDQLFLSGINHVFFHGTPYSPKGAPWPGWQFYASVDFSPYNTIWHDIPAFTKYISRCQSFLQQGEPDNDVLVYWPLQDVWYNQQGSLIYQLPINKIADWLEPTSFYQLSKKMTEQGYSLDFISDKYILQTTLQSKLLKTPGASYKALVIPSCHFMPESTMKAILELAKNGAKVIFADHLPEDVPGLNNLEKRRAVFKGLENEVSISSTFNSVSHIAYGKGEIIYGTDIDSLLKVSNTKPEHLVDEKLKFIRRKDPDGYHYFLANQEAEPIDGWVPLGVKAASAIIFDPYTGLSGIAQIKTEGNHSKMYLQIKPGQSFVIRTFTDKKVTGRSWIYYERKDNPLTINSKWHLSFMDGTPVIKKTFDLDSLTSWTGLNDSTKVFAGTGKYDVSFKMPNVKADEWLLNLGKMDVSARVKINGHDAGVVWAVPFQIKVGKFLKKGENQLSIEVTNLPANRIADYDRKGIPWKIFDDINVVNLDYKPLNAADWKPLPSGLSGPVQLIPLKKMAENFE